MNTKRLFSTISGLVAMAVLLAACNKVTPTPLAQEALNPAPLAPTAIIEATTSLNVPSQPATTDDLSSLRNAVYQLDILNDALPQSGGAVTLYDGVFEQKHPNSAEGVVVRYLDGAAGDLNNDGVQDAIALVSVSTGGTGSFIHLAAFTDQNGELTEAASEMLGDRVKVDSMQIQDGKIKLAMTVQGPKDPMCCPSMKVDRTYILDAGHLLTEKQASAAPYAETVIEALKNKDWETLAAAVHPDDGVRFSPYGNIKETDLSFLPDELRKLPDDPTIYNWGAWDGSGEPIQMTFQDYFQRFVYSKDFAQPDQISFDRLIGMGNTLVNTSDFYPDDVVVEYYIGGKNPDYGGMDWQSLKLVFRQDGDAWHLVGIIHDEWTI